MALRHQTYSENLAASVTCSALALVLVCLLSDQLCQAEFVQTGPGVYQSAALTEKVVVTEIGVMAFNTQPIAFQLFNPEQVLAESTKHFFLRYNSSSNSYTELMIGESSYSIVGNLTFVVGTLRIALDSSSSYLSIVSTATPAVLGIKGLGVVVNEQGQAAVDLLEANQFPQYRKLVVPYQLVDDKLYAAGQPLRSKSIGIIMESPRAACLNDKGQAYLMKTQLEEVLNTHDRSSRLRLLSKYSSSNKVAALLQRTLLLREDAHEAIGLDFMTGEIYRLRCQKAFVLVEHMLTK